MRVFGNRDIQRVINDFAGELQQRRTLTRAEVAELLQELDL